MENSILVIFGILALFINTNNAVLENDIILVCLEPVNITSANYPNQYNSNADILWRVVAPLGHRVVLHFTDFNTEQGRDYVTVYEGRAPDFMNAEQRIHISGYTLPHNITSIGSFLWVRFTSDVETTKTGFRALLSCVGTSDISLTFPEAVNLTSPNFPNVYDNNADVLWKVTAPPSYRVVLQFKDFRTQLDYDNVTVFEGRAAEFEKSVKRIQKSGKTIPSNIISVGSYLWLRFMSDHRHSENGFRAVVSCVDIRVINLTTAETANVTSPNFPNQYDNNTDVLWKVIAPSGYRVMVSFYAFNTETGYDFVTIFEGRKPDFEESTEREKLSGNPRLLSYTSIGSYLWLRFTSDGFTFNTPIRPIGFRALLSCFTIRDISLVSAETAEVQSPNFPNQYDNYADILWRVVAPSDYRVLFHFTTLDTEPEYDFVTIYEGRVPEFEKSVKRIQVSGYESQHNITSIGSYLWIRFTSDRKNEYNISITCTGFKAQLSSLPISAILLTTAKSASVSSPNFPYLYDSNTDILWKVIAPSGYRVIVSFSAFNTMSGYDFVTIYEGRTTDFKKAVDRITLSGSTLPDNITSTGSYVWLRFTSGDELESCISCSGFMAVFSTDPVQGYESQSPTAAVINSRVSDATPKRKFNEDTLHSVVIASISSSLTLLLIGLIIFVLFVRHRRRSKNAKTICSSSRDDDSTDNMYRNPVYGANDDSPDNIISASTPSTRRSPSDLHQSMSLDADVFEKYRKENCNEMPQTNLDNAELTYCCIDDLSESDKPNSVMKADLPNIYEECGEEDILDHKSLADNVACNVSQGTISCIREKAPREIHPVGLIAASNKSMPKPSEETSDALYDGSKCMHSPTLEYFTLEKPCKHDTGNDEHNDFEFFHEISLNGTWRAESSLKPKASSEIKQGNHYLELDKQKCSNPKLNASGASLCHEEDYNSLDFKKSGASIRSISKSQTTLSRHGSIENSDKAREGNSYGVLNVQKNPHPRSPLNVVLHDDNVYNSLSDVHPDQ